MTFFELLCGGLPWPQIQQSLGYPPPSSAATLGAAGAGAAAGSPTVATALDKSVPGGTSAAAAGSAVCRIRVPAAAIVLLQLSAGSTSAGQRCAVLSMLCALCIDALPTVARANLSMLAAQPGWEALLLQLMAAPEHGAVAGHAGSPIKQQQERECSAQARRLLVALLAHAMQHISLGWQRLQSLLALLRSAPAEAAYLLPPNGSPVDGWLLGQHILTTVIRALLAAQAADSGDSDSQHSSLGLNRRSSTEEAGAAWTLVSQAGRGMCGEMNLCDAWARLVCTSSSPLAHELAVGNSSIREQCSGIGGIAG